MDPVDTTRMLSDKKGYAGRRVTDHSEGETEGEILTDTMHTPP